MRCLTVRPRAPRSIYISWPHSPTIHRLVFCTPTLLPSLLRSEVLDREHLISRWLSLLLWDLEGFIGGVVEAVPFSRLRSLFFDVIRGYVL